MPNIAAILKSEFSRVARKEVRAETSGLKKSVATYRGEIAALKRRAQALEQQLRHLAKAAPETSPVATEQDSEGAYRFSAKGLASQRKRLGLSAPSCGLLLGTSVQSIYNWEQGKSRPLKRHLAAIAALRTLGKREAAAIVESRARAG
jgi:DNA-binding transcriptional regulator YiaG